MKQNEKAFDEVDEDYRPSWLSIPRTFQDKRSVEAEHFNQLLTVHLHSSVEEWDCAEDGWTFKFAHCLVVVDTEENGVLKVQASSEVMPRQYLDGMRLALRDVLHDSISLWWSSRDLAITLLQVVEEVVAWKDLWRNQLMDNVALKGSMSKSLLEEQLQDDQRRKSYTEGLDTETSLDADMEGSVHSGYADDPALELLGESIESICSGIRRDYKILHVEPVFRHDLVSRFKTQQTRIHQQLKQTTYSRLRECVSPTVIRPRSVEDTRDRLARHLSEPCVTFHGAPRRLVKSIVRWGFIVPGQEVGATGVKLDVRCGSSFGKGIYSSPDSTYASGFLDYQSAGSTQPKHPSEVPGMRLLVCATLMGLQMRAGKGLRSVESPFDARTHSHIDLSGFEYVVFNSAQIIPCYVLHLDNTAEHAQMRFEQIKAAPARFFEACHLAKHEEDDVEWENWLSAERGGNESKRAALKAAARKWLPYGFGPAQGTSFVIEDMAEHSDDEELYGEFQDQRTEHSEGRKGTKKWDQSRSWLDEYQLVRRNDINVNVWDE